jgi:ribA/ribD-fused uncharacterized protein
MTETKDGFTFFWRPDSPFSQWHPCTFTADGHTFSCAEQYMMRGKAVLFGDEEIAAQVLASPDPRSHKALGRKVKHFDDHAWKKAREGIVLAGNRAKFTQNPALLEVLLATKGTQLVEASPTDRIWGIGMTSSNPAATDPTKWRGQNLLGRILTQLRDELLAA